MRFPYSMGPHIMWIVAIAVVIMTYLVVGCSTDTGSAPTNDCYQASDSTMVCGDTNFKVY